MSLFSAAKNHIHSAWLNILTKRPDDLVQALRMHYGPKKVNFQTRLSEVPNNIEGFHDLAFLFASHQATRGIIAQDIDEAAYIWKLIAEKKPANILEIGRWLGGSTFLITSAARLYGGVVVSVDKKIKAPDFAKDENIVSAFNRARLDNCKLVIADSRRFEPESPINFAFIDGDHSYNGVKADYENIIRHMTPGSDLLFHDSANQRQFATYHEEVGKFMQELKDDSNLMHVGDVGSISHFKKNK